MTQQECDELVQRYAQLDLAHRAHKAQADAELRRMNEIATAAVLGRSAAEDEARRLKQERDTLANVLTWTRAERDVLNTEVEHWRRVNHRGAREEVSCGL
jgi:hypothetical protein